MLNVNRMRILREVASRGGIAAAANALYTSPSAISQQMAVLEREAGVKLLERSGRSVKLTDAGIQLVAHAEHILAILERAQTDLAIIAQGNLPAGPIRVCAFPTAARSILIPAVVSLAQTYPFLEPIVSDLEPEESIPMLKARGMDVVMIYEFDHLAPSIDPGIERHALMNEPMYIALPETDPKATGSLKMTDLADRRWIVGRDGSSLLEIQIHVANQAGYNPLINFHSNDYQVILAAVQAGLGVALVPPLAMFASVPGVVLRIPEDIRVTRSISALVRSGSSKHPSIAAALKALTYASEEASSRSFTPRPIR